MSLDTNFNVNPYYDDFDEDKKFLRMLFKPGYAVQARELTQLQTILQKQVERFGNHIFKNGSVVTGGQTFYQDVIYLKLDSTYEGVAVSANAFVGQTLVDNISIPTKRAEVIKVFDADAGTGDPKTLLVKQSFGDPFTDGEKIMTYVTAEDTVSANIATSGVGSGQTFSINEGVFYYDGFFIKNSAQTVAVSKYTTTGNARIGFEITESTISATSDTSLLDPAQDASNYQAPGSDRYQIDLVLATRSLESTDDTKFIEIARFENGRLTKDQRYPLYSVLEDTLARRTYDESGNYTVKPFRLSLQDNAANTANMDVILSPGKAYVYGYEHETIGSTVLTVPKPRTTSSVSGKRITADYGYYVYSNTHFGTFPINSMATVDLHCVVNSSINISTTATTSNTKIGTARIKTVEFDYASNTQNSATYNYKTFLFDVNVGSLTGTVNSAINISTVQIANTLVQTNYRSSVNNAYVGSKFRISSGPGVGETPKLITNYNFTNQTITLDSPFIATLTNASVWAIDFEFNDTKSIVVTNSGRVAAADIDTRSRDASTLYGDTYIAETSLEPAITKLGDDYVTSGSISGVSMSYRRLYESQTFAAGLSPALSVGSGESLSTGSASTSRQQNYQVVVTAAGTSSYEVGKAIPANLFTVDTVTRKITVTNGNNLTANIYATIDVTAPNPKAKTYVAANTSLQIGGGTDIFANGGVNLFASNGQIHIAANTIIRTPDTPQFLHVPDVVGLVSVLDFNGKYITDANAATATDVTARYNLNSGQKDSYYDHGFISLKSGYPAPTGPIVVKFNKFTSSGAGYFSVDSYSGYDYGSIPVYNGSNGERYELRDCLDFRPVRSASTVATANTVSFDVDSSTTGPKIPENGSDILISYSYYLPRTDKVVLNKNRTFEVVQGIPALNPDVPKDKDGGMTLYTLRSPAYVANTSNVNIQFNEHKRYTMRDIGAIEKRVENLEYYTSLSLLEQSTLNKQDLTILDSQNLPRFKNGILVDQFAGHSIADVAKGDYKASIDPLKRELRPSFNVSSQLLELDIDNSTGITQSGSVLTLQSTDTVFVDQPKASKPVNINPFNITNFLGRVTVEPKSDVWLDTVRQPDVQLNVGGTKDAWDEIVRRTGGTWSYEWGDWQTYWTGVEKTGATEYTGGRYAQVASYGTQYIKTTQEQSRSGTAYYLASETITQNIGDRLVDLSIIPYMRNRNVVVVGTDFKPNTTMYPFFDGTLVEKYTARANKFLLAQNKLAYRTTSGDYERVNIHDNTTNTTNGSAYVVRTSNTEAFVVSVSPNTSFSIASANLIGEDTSTSVRIVGYEHYSGFANGASSSVIQLGLDAAGANNITDYNAATIFIVSGTGAGQQATIQSYNPATRNVTISGTWTTTPVPNDSVYSIGRLKTTSAGDVAGVYSIPASTFRIGEKQLRLIDNNQNDVVSSYTNGETSFFAQGIVQTVEATILSVTQPTTQRMTVTDERVVVTNTTKTVLTGWYDPLAQTFLVDPSTYPEGLFIQKLRTNFKTKDSVMPVTLQLRPTVNGVPSSSIIYPGGTVTLTPDKVNISESPSLDVATKYTEFVFDNPIYLQPGEHSFVFYSNSNKYEVWAAEVGKLDIVANRQISEQPYGGSLFLSQNGSTWTPDQTSDMMFRIYRKDFSRTPATVKFKTVAPSSNVIYDLAHFIAGDLQIANTSIAYAFNSTVDGTGASAGFKPVGIGTDYSMNDGYGRRVVTTSNNSLTLQATMTTINPAISPVIDASRMGVVLVENIINNLPLSNSGIVVSSIGSGYANSSDITVTVSGGGGSGATAVANVVANTVDAVYITYPGSGYTTSPTITLTPGSGGGSGAVVSYNGEDKKTGGNSDVRYITRKVVLNDGFDSGDLRVYLTAYKPSLSNINVYYKILSKSDPDEFDNKNYQLMTQLGNENFTSTNEGDYREIMFAPGTTGAANNSVSYTSGSTGYSTFKTFAIKIVMSGTSTVDVPKVRDVRAIALPAG